MIYNQSFLLNLISLHQGEELLRQKSLETITTNQNLTLHIQITENVMDLLDAFRQFETDDEDLKVVQVLGIRQFNALASAIKLMFSGYYQTSALILRDVLETVFLVDYFKTDRAAITKWRMADKSTRMKDFKPVKIREALDKRDGFTGNKRASLYALFSDLAGHASMEGTTMLRPKGMDIHMGPFFDSTALDATLAEMARLAVQIGESLNSFVPHEWKSAPHPALLSFYSTKLCWLDKFYPKSLVSLLGRPT